MSATQNHHFWRFQNSAVKFFGSLLLYSLALPALTQSPPSETDETGVVYQEPEDSKANTGPGSGETSPKDPLTIKKVLKQRHQYLSDNLDQPQTVWLPYRDDELLAFSLAPKSATAKGAILVIPNLGTLPLEDPIIAQMMQNLPKHGWYILAVTLPEPPAQPIPLRPKESIEMANPPPNDTASNEQQVVYQEAENTSEAQTTDGPEITSINWEDFDNKLAGAITAAVDHLHQQGQYNLVLTGLGSGAFYALQHSTTGGNENEVKSIATNKEKAVFTRDLRAVMLINPSSPRPDAKLTSLLNQPVLPILDLFPNRLGLVKTEAEQRYLAAQKADYPVYLQKPMPLINQQESARVTVKYMRGFIDRHAAGKQMQ